MKIKILSALLIFALQSLLLGCSFSDNSNINDSDVVGFNATNIKCDSVCVELIDVDKIALYITNDSLYGEFELKNTPDSFEINNEIIRKPNSSYYEIDYSYKFYFENETKPAYSASIIALSDSTGKRYVGFNDINFKLHFIQYSNEGGWSLYNEDYLENMTLTSNKFKFVIKTKSRLVSFEKLKDTRVDFEMRIENQSPTIERIINLKKNGT